MYNKKMGSLSITASSRSIQAEAEADSVAQLHMGATTVYGPNEVVLHKEIEVLAKAIRQSALQHICLAKNVLGKLARERVGVDRIEKRLFGAILGYQLRLGRLETIVCSSLHNKILRVYVHPEKLKDFRLALEAATELLEKRDVLSVSELESKLFGGRRYNTWSCASHILARLIYIGIAEYIDKYSVRPTPSLQDAFRSPS